MLRQESMPDIHERNYLGGGCLFLIGTILYILGFTVPFWPSERAKHHDNRTADYGGDYTGLASAITSTSVDFAASSGVLAAVARDTNRSGISNMDEIMTNRWMLVNFVLRSMAVGTLTLTAFFAACLFVGLVETHCPRFMRYSGIFSGIMALVSEVVLWASLQADSTHYSYETLASAFCTVGGLLCTAGGFMFCHVYPLNARMMENTGCCASADRRPGSGLRHSRDVLRVGDGGGRNARSLDEIEEPRQARPAPVAEETEPLLQDSQ
nr:hypothetical protein BaRGS_024485 [Batillaria attramentaria]